jgi:helicase MOV-10
MPPPNIDYQTFVSSFCGSSFLKVLQPSPGLFGGSGCAENNAPVSLENLNLTDNETVSNLPAETKATPLTPETYAEYHVDLMRTEIAALNEVSQSYNLYSVPVCVHDLAQHLFRLAVPGLRENTPMIQLGDMVRLRQIRPEYFGYPSCFTGYEYETFVFGMDKTEGYIVLRADGLWIETGAMFNVVFCVQEQLWDSAHRAVTDIGLQLNPPAGGNGNAVTNGIQSPHVPSFINPPPRANTFLRRMLFPENTDGEMQHTAKSSVYRRRWFDKELNFEQVRNRVLMYELWNRG